jgi:hypothetical protein
MSAILLNDTIVNTPSGPLQVRAGETVVDSGLLASLPTAGGVLWPSNDLTVLAQAAIVLTGRGKKGWEEYKGSVAMLAAAINTMALGDTVVNLPVAALTNVQTLSETPNGYVPSTQGGNVVSAVYIPTGALTASNSAYATISVFKRTAGGAGVLLAAVTTQIAGGSGNWTAWVPVSIPVVAAPVSAGDVLTCTITQTGGGVAVPSGQLIVNVD